MNRRALLFPILAIAAFLRLYQLTTTPPGLYRDEAVNGSNALEVLETGRFHVFYPQDNGREGLYINVASGFVKTWGNRPWVLRLPAAIFGVLTVWGVYLLTAELAPVDVALLAAFFLATSFWHIDFSRIAFRAIAAPCFLTWSLYLLLVSVRRTRDRQAGLGIALLAGACYGLGCYTYIAYRATPVLLGFVLVYRARKSGWVTAVFVVAACVITLPLAIYFLQHPGSFLGRTSQVAVFQFPHPAWELTRNLWRTGRMLFTRGDVNWRHNVAWRAELFWPVQIFFVAGLVWEWRRAGAPEPRSGERLDFKAIALCWLAVAAAPVVLTGQGVPHALRAILMIPAICMLAAEGAYRIYGKLAAVAPPILLRLATVTVVLALAYEPYHTYFEVWAKNPNVPPAFDAGAVEVARQIALLPREIPKYVVAPDSMAAQPVMFLTRSYTAQEQRETNIHYRIGAACGATPTAPQATEFCLP